MGKAALADDEPVFRMSREEYRDWAEQQPTGRFERVAGVVVAMAPERAGHNRRKRRAYEALDRALHAAGLPCEVYTDGITVEVDDSDYEPDAVLHCGERLSDDAVAVPDPYQWSVLLRALSAFEVYRRVYRDVITPTKVAQMLILRDDMPRSLLRCCKEVYQNLRSVANEHSAETERRAGEMHAMLHFTRMEDIAAGGLPHFLEAFLGRVRDLGDRIASDFLVPPAEA